MSKWDFTVYPDNSVCLLGKYLKASESKKFLKSHRIDKIRLKDGEKKTRKFLGYVFSNSDGKPKETCRCGKTIESKYANQCLSCYHLKSSKAIIEYNKAMRGKTKSFRSYEDLMKYHNVEDRVFVQTKYLKDWSWTGSSGFGKCSLRNKHA